MILYYICANLTHTAMKKAKTFLGALFTLMMLFPALSTFAQSNQQQQRQVDPSKLVKIENEYWRIWCSDSRLESIVNLDDELCPVFPGRAFGDVLVNYKVKDGMWQSLSQNKRAFKYDEANGCVIYSDTALAKTVVMTQKFYLEGNQVKWDIELQNFSKFPVMLGDVAPAFPWSKRGGNIVQTPDEPKRAKEETFERNFTKHQFIKGDNSYLYYTRYGGQMPSYVWTAKNAHLEYWTNANGAFRVYLYAGKVGGEETRGSWRLPHTYGELKPAGQPGDKISFSFAFNDARSYDEIRDIIYNEGMIDIRVLPAMTIPRTQYGYFSLHTQCKIDSVTAEFPAQTRIESLGLLSDNTYGYKVQFDRLGENQITVHYDGGKKTYLEYFSILSPETMMKERARFLVETQQIKNPDRWFDGLYGPYDMKNGKLLTPDEPDIYDRVRTYFIASDDPALGKAPYLASKNVVFPNDEEIASLEYHIENFVWGGLQRTDKETPYPYAIYGTPNYYINRNLDLKDTQGNFKPGVMRAWRSFDYAHMVMLYYHMYQIAKLYPEKSKYLDAAGYLERAFQTAKGYFNYPTELHGDYYETFKWGCYNELVIPLLIEDLIAEGRAEDAAYLQGFWERKAKYFIYDDPYPYHSEYEVDRTAYESSYALAEWAIQHPMQNDDSLWYDNNYKVWYSHPNVTNEASWDFLNRQHYANVSCRGYLESEWNTLGADFAGSSDGSEHSYMARMGGWSVLNYALRFDKTPNNWLPLGYASYLNPYGVMNVGDEESNYGYWYPGKEKNGAIGQAYTSQKFGKPWIGTEENRGPWRFCGEGDLGMCAITRTATSVLIRDTIFDWFYYGGNFEKSGKSTYKLYPDDGVRQDLWIVTGNAKVHMHLNRDNWSAEKPIVVDVARRTATITIANGVESDHNTEMWIESFKCKPSVKDGKTTLKSSAAPRGMVKYNIAVNGPEKVVTVSW